MGKLLRILIIAALCAPFLLLGSKPGAAVPTLEETRQLLQKGLNLAELDQEIARLSAQEVAIGEKIIHTEQQIAANQAAVEETRQHAAKVLRAYYMGERANMWLLMLSSRSLSEALTIYEYFNMIISNDQLVLSSYSASYHNLSQAMLQLQTDQEELQEVKAAFLAEREKAVAIQQDIEATISASADADALREELDRFTVEWKEKGVPLFRKYLSSISEAMQGLPELLTGKNAEKFITEINLAKRSMVFRISDTDLNEFFRTKNPLFENISFVFEDGKFQAFGKEDQVDVSITGRYTVENTDGNKLLFHVDQLTYSGFILPESSNRSLEQEFDLGFTPSRYVKGIEVTEATMQDHYMSLTLGQK
ncbi:MAG: hypothetical protein K0R57_5314 [Paenibacillaceae bacterium]|jgi:hypothetical protein|nr:hypothetical protein [Paenibacillaceae bacterium]